MVNEEHLARLKEGVEAWNAWRITNPRIQPNFYQADLGGATLGGANLHGADLHGATLDGATLRGASLDRADLTEATLDGANLTEATLIEANLSRATLSGATLSGTDLHEATIGWTIWENIDLSTAPGLEMVQHQGPSTIGIDTLYRSQGNIPEVFLRGAGVPDEMIRFPRI